MTRVTAVLVVVMAAGCSRGGASVADAGSDAAIATSAIDAAPTHDSPPEVPTPATGSEARRARLTKLDDEPGLAKNEDAIKAHFGGALPKAMRLQAVPLAEGRQALLLEDDAKDARDSRPILLLAEATGAAVWTKEHPSGGILPPVKGLALAPRPENGLALFFYDEPTRLVAVRMWDSVGYPFADLQLFDLIGCDAVSAAYAPARGWVAIASYAGGMRAQLVREGGTNAWGTTGVSVGAPWRAAAPASIVFDGDASWMLAQHATVGGADHVVVMRYDLRGNAVAKTPIDLGAVANVADTMERVDATRARTGVARVVVAGRAVEVRSDGVVTRL